MKLSLRSVYAADDFIAKERTAFLYAGGEPLRPPTYVRPLALQGLVYVRAWPASSFRAPSSILALGPCVLVRWAARMYVPLMPEGRARLTASMSVARLPRIWSWLNEDFPTTVWMTPVLSTRNSTRPPFASRTALATSKVTVPDFGLGMSPRGPSTRPRRPT